MFRIVDGKGYGLGDNLFRNHSSFVSILEVQYAPSFQLCLKRILHFRSQASHVRGLEIGTLYTKLLCLGWWISFTGQSYYLILHLPSDFPNNILQLFLTPRAFQQTPFPIYVSSDSHLL